MSRVPKKAKPKAPARIDPFEQIATDAIEAAEEVDVDFPEFVTGLEAIAHALRDRLAQAHDELRSKQDVEI